jgi:hypothetical protein
LTALQTLMAVNSVSVVIGKLLMLLPCDLQLSVE